MRCTGVQLFVTDECKSRQKEELISREAERTGTGQTQAHAVTETRLKADRRCNTMLPWQSK